MTLARLVILNEVKNPWQTDPLPKARSPVKNPTSTRGMKNTVYLAFRVGLLSTSCYNSQVASPSECWGWAFLHHPIVT